MTKIIYAIHAPETAHLDAVKADMLRLGAPTIRVVDCSDYYMAIEGSHRLAAAHALGIMPVLEVIEQDDVIDISDEDWYDACNWTETAYPAGEVAGELFNVRSPSYRFDRV